MKTPEEIFNHHASRIMKQFDMDNFKRDYPSLWKTIEESLKSMQSDHEKELIEYIRFSAWMEIGEEKLEWMMMTSQQRLTQFRNKQQDR